MESKFHLLLFCLVILNIAHCRPSDEETTTTTSEPTATKSPKEVASQGEVRERERLRQDLFRNYDRLINPDNVTVKFGLAVINFDIDEQKSSVESDVWLRMVWKDSRLVWDEADYGGVSVLRLDPDIFWKPDVTLYNSADPANMISCWKSHTLLYPTGEVLWVPPCHASSTCQLTLEEFPYGEQNCSLKFGSWTYDGTAVGLTLYNQKEEVDFSDYWESPKWEIVSNSAKLTNKYYDCCAEPYPDITFRIIAKRRNVIPGHKNVTKTLHH